jgi:hypothetical protein
MERLTNISCFAQLFRLYLEPPALTMNVFGAAYAIVRIGYAVAYTLIFG